MKEKDLVRTNIFSNTKSNQTSIQDNVQNKIDMLFSPKTASKQPKNTSEVFDDKEKNIEKPLPQQLNPFVGSSVEEDKTSISQNVTAAAYKHKETIDVYRTDLMDY